MYKKLIMACMAIAAFAAFVVAPAASASPVLTEPTGVGLPTHTLAVGSSIKGTNIGDTEFLGGFNVVCTHAEMAGTVTKNSGTKIAGEIPKENAKFTGTGAGGDCTSAIGDVAVKVTSKLCMETGEFTTQNKTKHKDGVLITGCGENVTFDLTTTAFPETTCRYSIASIVGVYTTSPADARIRTEGQAVPEETPDQFLCPNSGTLKMEFELTTTSGATLLVS